MYWTMYVLVGVRLLTKQCILSWCPDFAFTCYLNHYQLNTPSHLYDTSWHMCFRHTRPTLQCESKYKTFHARKCIWNLRNGDQKFCSGGDELKHLIVSNRMINTQNQDWRYKFGYWISVFEATQFQIIRYHMILLNYWALEYELSWCSKEPP